MSAMNNNSGMTFSQTRGAGLFIALGYIFAVISLIYFPLLFAVLGVLMGVFAMKRGSRGGVAVVAANIILGAIGLFMSQVILTRLQLLLGL